MSCDALGNVFDQMGCCGIWCGSCAVGTSAMMELALRYRELWESHGLGTWGADGFDYAAFLQGLESIAALPGCAGCRQGGGRYACELRACASFRGLETCSSCGDQEQCEHGEILHSMRLGARDAGLFAVESPQDGPLSEERRREILASLWWWRALYADCASPDAR